MNLENSINVDTLDKITKRITCTLVISLLPFICYLTYLDCGNYKTIPIRVVLVYSILIFINLILVVINYLSIYKNFSTGFFSTYKNNTNVDLDELLNTTEQDINRFNKEVTDLHGKITDLEEKSKSNYVDQNDAEDDYNECCELGEDAINLLKNLENTDAMKLLSSIHRLMVNIDLIYLIMLIMFTQGLITVSSVMVNSSNAIYFFITIVIAAIATFIFNKLQRNKTQDTLLDLFKVKEDKLDRIEKKIEENTGKKNSSFSSDAEKKELYGKPDFLK